MNKPRCCCINCKEEVTSNNIEKHFNSKSCQKGGKFETVNFLERCPYCFKNKSQIENDFSNHVRWCSCNPKREQYLRDLKERILTPHSNETKEKISKKIRKLHQNGFYDAYKEQSRQNPPFLGRKHSQKSRLKMSESARNSNHQRVCKTTHTYQDKHGRIFKFDSKWEDYLADRLDELDITWERPEPIKYVLNEKEKNYFPDFYLPTYDLYLDPKNAYVEKQQKQKLDIIKNKINLIILRSEEECKKFQLSQNV